MMLMMVMITMTTGSVSACRAIAFLFAAHMSVRLLACALARLLCVSGIFVRVDHIVLVWVGPQDATPAGLQRIMRRRGGSQSDTTP